MNTLYPKKTEQTRLIRAERTEIEGISVDYLLSLDRKGYSLSVESGGRCEKLTDYTNNSLLAEAFYLLIREEKLLPGTLTDLWQEYCAQAERCPTNG